MLDEPDPFGRTQDGQVVPGRIRRSRRARRVSLVVHPDRVELVVPVGVPLDGPRGAMAFLRARRDWVIRTWQRVRSRIDASPGPAVPVDGGLLLVEGLPWRLAIRPDDVATVTVEPAAAAAVVHVSVPRDLPEASCPQAVARALDAWRAACCLARARPLAVRFAARLGLTVADVRASRDRSRWGSCLASGILKVHLRLAAAPPELLEYIVAHEVAHLRWRGHGPRFYRTLAGLLPDWEARRRQLRAFEKAHPDLLL